MFTSSGIISISFTILVDILFIPVAAEVPATIPAIIDASTIFYVNYFFGFSLSISSLSLSLSFSLPLSMSLRSITS